jgi:predicted alpha/beta-fold hydrolase
MDDPFMTPEVLPGKDELSKNITLEVSKNGGHVGFVSGSFFRPEYWLEKRVLEYFLS